MTSAYILTDALKYARRGWPVFPVEPGGKRPMTRRGLHDATTDMPVIVNWWNTSPTANVGVRTGAESELVVLDIDGEVGAESLHDLERENGPLPRTASVCTPRGGQHYYFRWPGIEVRNSAGTLAPGIDVRGDGGYVLAPSSVGPNGRLYEPDERVPIAPMPPWLRVRLCEPDGEPKAATPTGEWLRIVRGVSQGERNDAIARIAGHLLRRYIDVDLAAELLHLVNSRFRPPLDSSEVDRALESICVRELRRRQQRQGA
jgi:hypothetical protein